jgi:hypothetical protein
VDIFITQQPKQLINPSAQPTQNQNDSLSHPYTSGTFTPNFANARNGSACFVVFSSVDIADASALTMWIACCSHSQRRRRR